MILRLLKDYFNTDYYFDNIPLNKIKKKKRKCYMRFIYLFCRFFVYLITAPILYPIWYIFKSKIAWKLYRNFPISNYEEIYGYSYSKFNEWLNIQIHYRLCDINKLKCEIKSSLSLIEYQLWLYGDIYNVESDGGIPANYKSHIKNTFIRRWCYSGFRNPKFNSVYLNFYAKSCIIELKTVYDSRTNQVAKNYGTAYTRVGQILRWYVTDNGELWYIWDSTYKSRIFNWRLFYFGGVCLGDVLDGVYPKNILYSRFEWSWRPCSIIDS